MPAETSGRKPATDLARAAKDAALAALVAFGLFLPLVGFKTVANMRTGVELETRWPLLFALVAIVAAARFLRTLMIARREERPRPPSERTTAFARGFGRSFTPLALAFVVVYPVLA